MVTFTCMRYLAPLAFALILLAGCSSSDNQKAEMVCIQANQELRSLVPRVNQAEKAGLDQSVTLRAMSQTVSDAADKLERLNLSPQADDFSSSARRLADLYSKAARSPRKATATLAEAQTLQAKMRLQAKKANLGGCGGKPPAHNHEAHK